MTMTVIILSLAMSVPAGLLLLATSLFAFHAMPDPPEEARADWRRPSGRHLYTGRFQRTAASIATATNSSAR
jgi:hypothetical protein